MLCLLVHHVYLLSFWRVPNLFCACFCTTSICCLSGGSKISYVLACAPRLSVVFWRIPNLFCGCFCTTSICCLSGVSQVCSLLASAPRLSVVFLEDSKSAMCLLVHHVYLLSSGGSRLFLIFWRNPICFFLPVLTRAFLKFC